MARSFNGSSDKLAATGTTATAYPFTLACWFRPPDTVANKCLVWLGDRGTTAQYAEIRIGGAGPGIQARSNAGSGAATAVSSASIAATTWQHAAGVFTASNSRAAFLNGAGKGTNTTSRNFPTGVDGVSLGVQDQSGATDWFDGALCEAAMWSVALTDAEVLSLAQGALPPRVRPGALVFYAPVWGKDSPEPALFGTGLDMTVTGTSTATTGHGVVRPSIWLPSEGAVDAVAGAVSETPTPGGATAAGTGPVARVAAVTGGADAQGVAATARASVTIGGAAAGGTAPSDSSSTSETPTPGGATAQGVSPASTASLAASGAAAGGNPLGTSTPVTQGGATAAGNAAAAGAAHVIVGVDAGGQPILLVYVAAQPGGATAGGQLVDPLAVAIVAHFDAPSPAGGSDPGSPASSRYDAPSPGVTRA